MKGADCAEINVGIWVLNTLDRHIALAENGHTKDGSQFCKASRVATVGLSALLHYAYAGRCRTRLDLTGPSELQLSPFPKLGNIGIGNHSVHVDWCAQIDELTRPVFLDADCRAMFLNPRTISIGLTIETSISVPVLFVYLRRFRAPCALNSSCRPGCKSHIL